MYCSDSAPSFISVATLATLLNSPEISRQENLGATGTDLNILSVTGGTRRELNYIKNNIVMKLG